MPRPVKGEGNAIKWIKQHIDHVGEPCLIWPFYRMPNGYGQLGWNGSMHYAHRLMCQFVHGEAPEKHEAAHECGNGALGCVHPKHLFWKTKSQNRIDALRHGTGVIRRSGPRGSLTEEQVMAIRALKGKEKQATIAQMFGISEPRVRAIFTGRIYNKPTSFRL